MLFFNSKDIEILRIYHSQWQSITSSLCVTNNLLQMVEKVNEGDIVHKGKEIVFPEHYPHLYPFLQSAYGHSVQDVLQCYAVVIHGLDYRKGCVIVESYDDADFPCFVVLQNVIVVQHQKYFIVEKIKKQYDLMSIFCHMLL